MCLLGLDRRQQQTKKQTNVRMPQTVVIRIVADSRTICSVVSIVVVVDGSVVFTCTIVT